MPTSPAVASWTRGLRLREKREPLGPSGSDVVKPLGISAQFRSAVEHGKKKLPDATLTELLKTYGFDEDKAAELWTLREQANHRGWWSRYSALFSEELIRQLVKEPE